MLNADAGFAVIGDVSLIVVVIHAVAINMGQAGGLS